MTPTRPVPAFRLEKLTHSYPDGTIGLAEVTAELHAGETVAVLGPSGSGKSTLLALLGLLWDGAGPEGGLRFHDGQIDHDLLRLSPSDRAALRARAFGFVLQSSYLLPHFTCLENVGLPLGLHGWPAAARQRWVAALLATDGVDTRGDLRANGGKLPRQVSLGQRQRYGVLRAIATDPVVVFADEPSSNLDPGSTRDMFDLLAGWKAGTLLGPLRERFAADLTTPTGVRRWLVEPTTDEPLRTLVLVCHDMESALQRADRLLVLNSEHALEASFTRPEWDANAETVARILGLAPVATGRDQP